MAKNKKKYYVVWVGSKTGVFETWAECLLYTKGYPNAKYKSFSTRYEAEDAFMGVEHIPSTKKKSEPAIRDFSKIPEIILDSIAVDAACSGNPGKTEYRGVITSSSEEIFRMGPFEGGSNNIGEFLALVHGIAQMKKEGKNDKVIYSDSKIAMGWIRKKKCNTKIERTRENAKLFHLVDRGEKWLKENTFSNPLVKWETKKWGEIPADFGRK